MWKKLISLVIALVIFLTSMPLALAGSLVTSIMNDIELVTKAMEEGSLSEEEALELLRLLEEAEKADLPTPQNVRAEVSSYDSVTLSWDSVAGATYYNVHRSMNVAGPFTVLATNVASTTYVDNSGLICGSTYYYRVVARNTTDSSSFSAIVPVVVTPDVPTLVSATVTSATSAELTWTESQGASGYYIFRAETTTGSYGLLANIPTPATTTYTDTTLTTGVSYSYRIQAYTGAVTSDYSNTLSVVALPATPTNVKVKSTAFNALTISWDKVEGATKYRVMRSESESGNYVYVGETADTAYVDIGLQTGKEYFYKVAAIVNNVLSDYSVPASDTPRAEPVTGVTVTAVSDTVVRLSWALNLNAGYSAYRIEISTDGLTFTALSPDLLGVNTTTLDIPGLTTGQIYYFRVRGLTLMPDNTYYPGDPSAQVSIIPKPSTPENLKVENAGLTSLKISWDRVDSATGYEVYRSLRHNTGFEMIADVTATTMARESVTDINLQTGTTYYYRVVAYVLAGTTRIYSGYTGIANGMPAPLAPASLTATVTSYQSVFLAWTAVQGAEGYDILMSESEDGAFDIVTTAPADATSFGLNGLKIGVKYYFMVRAFVIVNGVHVPGTSSTVATVQILPDTVVWDGCSPYSISVDYLKWKEVPGATSYEVEWSENGTDFTLATTVTKPEAYITIDAGKIMYFRVRAVVSTDSKTFYGDYSTVFGFEPKPTTPVISSVTPSGMNALKIVWSTSADIASLDGGYYVYRGVTDDIGSMTMLVQLNRTDMNSYIDSTVNPGDTYYYAIQSYALTDYGLRTSFYSGVLGGYTRPAAPKSLAIFGKDASSFILTWSAGDSNAEAYEIYCATSEAGPYNMVGETTALTLVTPNSFKFGITYYFKVRARMTSGSNVIYSDFTAPVAATATLASPTNVAVTVASSTSVIVSWDEVADASGYFVFMSTVSGGTMTKAATVGAGVVKATISHLTAGQIYYFRVAAYYTYQHANYEGARSSEVSAMTALAAPDLTFALRDKNSITLKWNAVSGATSYRLYRKAYGTPDEFELIADGLTATSYIDAGLPTNVWYTYHVVPCSVLNGSLIEGTPSADLNAWATLLAPASIDAVHGSGTLAVVSWSRVTDASGYVLEVSDKSDTGYSALLTLDSGDTLNATVDLSVIGFTTTTFFRVCAFYRDPSTMKVYNGAYSAVVSLDTVPEAPAYFTAVQSGIGTAHLSWNEVSNATGYYIFMRRTSDPSFSLIAQAGPVSTFDVSGLSAGTEYEFAIRAYRVTGSNFVYGLYANTKVMINANVVPLSAPTNVTLTQGSNYSVIVKWDAVPNATGYRIFMSKDGGSYDQVGETTKLTITIPDLLIGSNYDFKVLAYTTNASGSQEGPESAPVGITITGPASLAAPNGLSISQTGPTSATVTWEAVSGAVGYYVFVSEGSPSSFKVKGSTTGLSLELTGLKKNTMYYAVVRAYSFFGGSVVYGDYPNAVSVKISAGTLEISSITYTVSEDGKSLVVSRPTVSGGSGTYSFTYYLWASDGTLAGTLTSTAPSVTLSPSPAVNGTYSVGVVVSDGESTATKQGDWLNIVGYPTAPMTVSPPTFTISGDGKSFFIEKPTVTGGTGLKPTFAYNIYDSYGNPVNYFYSDENVVAATPGASGTYNVFIVVNDGVNEQTVNIGWHTLTY